jgi:hypothetical protein
VLGECGVVRYGVERRWIEFGEGGMCVLAVKALLEAVDPELLAGGRKRNGDGHGFPVKSPGVRDAAAVGKLGEVDGVG